MSNTILLSLAIPFVGAALIGLLSRWAQLRDAAVIVIALALLATVYQLLDPVLTGQRPSWHVLDIMPGLALHFKVEPLGMLFAGVAALLWPITSLYAIGYMRGNNESHQTRFAACFAIAIGGAMGVAFAGNLLTLFIFYEVLTLSTYPLVTHKGNEAAKQGGRTYLSILLATSTAFLLPAMLWTWYAASTLEFVPGGILDGKVEGVALSILLLLFMYGIGKAALMPFHRWLPAAMVAPTPVSALLHAVAVVKAGVFSVIKILVYVFGYDLLKALPASQWILMIASFTIIVASVIALRQDNLKRRLAYSTISQLSYVVLAATIIAPLSLIGAALHIAAHAFGKITLFFAAGSIYTAAHKTKVSELDGIGWKMPWTMGAFTIGAISMIGLPPAAGFLSKWYLLMGAFDAGQGLAIAIIIGSTLLNAAYFVPIIYAAWFHSAQGSEQHGEAPLAIVAALVMTASLTVLLFFMPDIPLQLAQQLPGAGL